MAASLRHTGIVVKDLEGALDFWCSFMGFRVVKQMEESGPQIDAILSLNDARVTTVKLEDENKNMIELLKFHSHPGKSAWIGETTTTGLTHIALNVDNLDELYNQLQNLGYSFNSEPQVSKNGAVKVTYMKGPEGLFLELVESR